MTEHVEHQWVKHIVVPVNVVSDPWDHENFYAENSEEDLKIAAETAVHGCAVCDAPLGINTVQTSCPGKNSAIDTVAG